MVSSNEDSVISSTEDSLPEKTPAPNDEIFEQAERYFSRAARSVIFSEPKRSAALTFSFILICVLSLLTWASLAFINITIPLRGTITSPDPSVSITANHKFFVSAIYVSVGQEVGPKTPIAQIAAGQDGPKETILAGTEGIVVAIAKLQRQVKYEGGLQVALIRPKSSALTVHLDIAPETIGKVSKGMPVQVRSPLTDGTIKDLWTGTVAGSPVAEDGRYTLLVNLDQATLESIHSGNVTIIPGTPVQAEVLLKRKRVIQRLFGEE